MNPAAALLAVLLVLPAAGQDGKPDLDAADAAAVSGRWSEAEALYRAELERASDSTAAALGLARALEALGSPELAIAYYKMSILDGDPFAVGARARLLESLHRYDEAAEAYTRLMLLEPPSLDALLGLARCLESGGHTAEAAAAYRDVLADHPDRLEVRLSLGRMLEQSGQPAEAIQAYQPLLRLDDSIGTYSIDERSQLAAGAAEALGPLLVSVGESAAAAEVYLLLPDLLPEANPVAWYRAAVGALCESDPRRAAELTQHLAKIPEDITPEDGRVIVCVADMLYEQGDREGAKSAYRKFLTIGHIMTLPAGDTERAQRRSYEMGIADDARRLSLVADRSLSLSQRSRVQAAQADAEAGHQKDAIRTMQAIVAEARSSSEAWASLGDMHAEFGEIKEAEGAYLTALAIAPDDGRWRTRLALLLARAYSGRRHAQAVEEISLVIRSGPHPPALRFERATMHIGLRDFAAAEADLEAYLALAADGDRAEEARGLLRNLKRKPPTLSDPELAAEPMQDVPEAAETHYRRARVHRDRARDNNEPAELDLARREVARALEVAPDWLMALDMSAQLAWEAGEREAAVKQWEKALTIEGAPSRLRLDLAVVYDQLGQPERAEALRLEAADTYGLVDAYYELAQTAFDRGDYAAARRWLDRFFDSATGGPYKQTALALEAELDAIEQRRRLALGGGSGLAVVLAGMLWWRRTRQRTLDDLIEAAPECAHDLARLLSAVRHEVLKHNTTLLEEMAHAGRNGDHAALRWAAERLFGEDGGAVRRFEEYRATIERLGKKHGVILDLKRRDPVFAPMSTAIGQLKRMEGDLRDPERAGDLEARLASLHQVLNVEVYQALGRLIQQMGTLRIDAPLLAAVDTRVRAEPGLAEAALPPLAIDVAAGGLPARVFQGDLEDIVANLLRNAYLASIDGLPPEERTVSLVVEEDDDPIAGYELVALRFCDRAPGELTSAMIQGRSIGRGLGLAVDLIARHNGSIDVEDEPGWAKAVVVRLPRAEGEADDVVEVSVTEDGEEP